MVSWTSGIISSDESNMAKKMTITKRSIEECHRDYVEICEGRHYSSFMRLRTCHCQSPRVTYSSFRNSLVVPDDVVDLHHFRAE